MHPPRILLISGGSGGHIVPLVAVGTALKEMTPSAQLLYVCGDTPFDQSFLVREALPFRTLPRLTRSLVFPLQLLRNARTANSILCSWKPDVIFTKGSAISIPLCFLAWIRKLPVVAHESDAVMGRANRIITHVATTLCTGTLVSRSSYLAARVSQLVTGNPIRSEMTRGSREEALRITGLSGKRPILLVLGGSQGSQAINDAIRLHLPTLLKDVDIIHITGVGKSGGAPLPGYWARETVHHELAHFYAAASLALSRAGANTLAELAANGVPAIVVPLRGLAQDHQQKNAQAAASGGGCIVLQQQELQEKLPSLIHDCITESGKLTSLKTLQLQTAHPEASRRIAEILVASVA